MENWSPGLSALSHAWNASTVCQGNYLNRIFKRESEPTLDRFEGSSSSVKNIVTLQFSSLSHIDVLFLKPKKRGGKLESCFIWDIVFYWLVQNWIPNFLFPIYISAWDFLSWFKPLWPVFIWSFVCLISLICFGNIFNRKCGCYLWKASWSAVKGLLRFLKLFSHSTDPGF